MWLWKIKTSWPKSQSDHNRRLKNNRKRKTSKIFNQESKLKRTKKYKFQKKCKAYFGIDQLLEAFIEKISTKTQKSVLIPWKESVLTMIKEKRQKLSRRYSPNKENQHYVILMPNHIYKHSTSISLL